MERCNFQADREVHLNLSGKKDKSGNYEDDTSIDLIVKFSYKGKNCMIFFECKDVKKITNIKKELSAWENNIEKILKKEGKVKVINSSDNMITDQDFDKVDEIRLCFVFSKNLEADKYANYQEIMREKSFFSWDFNSLKYFNKISGILEEWTKYEIFREFNLSFETTSIHKEKAVKIKQFDFPEMYIMGLHPGLLLKISYVLRRTSQKPDAYQRMLNKERIKKISEFLSSNRILLPNAIIIAFDSEKNIQEEITYDGTWFKFPVIYCSAWIIDGQHRVFGFLNTKHKEWDEEKNEEFKLPVVVFKNLDETIQNKTFVNINYYQKKIDPTLLCDLATVTKDLKNELTWPSLLVTELNKEQPLKNKVKISEFDTGKPITLSSFARYGLLESLLGFNRRKNEYNGPLYKYASFDTNLEFDDNMNQRAFQRQLDTLKNFFRAVERNTATEDEDKNPWINIKKYSLLKTTGINALLLTLTRIFEKYPEMKINLYEHLKPLKKINFEKDHVASHGGGWKGFRSFANEIIKELNIENKDNLRLFGKKEKI